MIAEFKPSRPSGRVSAPPSKSMAHRLLICGALARGRSVIRGVSDSDDVRATLACLSALGASYTRTGDTVEIDGFDPKEPRACPDLNCNESGSTLRFLIPLCLLGGGERRFVGSHTLFTRPLSVYEDICRESGILFSRGESGLALNGKHRMSIKQKHKRQKPVLLLHFKSTGYNLHMSFVESVKAAQRDGCFCFGHIIFF